jgi:hypothetical protein
MQDKVKESSKKVEGVKESKYKLEVAFLNAESVHQFPSKLSLMITPAKDIEYIVSLYPNPLRTMHTVFQLEIDGATSPFFLHSQVAFAMIKIL